MMIIHKFLNLNNSEKIIIFKALVLLGIVRILLWILPFSIMKRFINRFDIISDRNTSKFSKEKLIWAIQTMSIYIPKTNCLTLALGAKILLYMYNYSSNIQIGVSRTDFKLEAHAWLESDNVIILGESNREYTPILNMGDKLSMSSITGILYRDRRLINQETILKMNNSLSHRGPDGSAFWNIGSVAIGHQMLYTTKESLHEILPFYDDKTDLAITADARIDNRHDLAIELDIVDDENISDSYFILKSYEKWGELCPKHLLGDFAFAIWDNNENKLFCARDHMGVKPFYYYLNENIFIFSTEIKALFTLSEVPKELNEKKLALYLNRDILDKELTFYKDIKSLPGAHKLIITSENFVNEIYWKLDPNFNLKMDTEEDYANAFRELFAEAVKCRLRSHYPIGFELSGGLDSSSIVCMAKKILRGEDENLRLILFQGSMMKFLNLMKVFTYKKL